MNTTEKIAVLCIGNLLLLDEGVGPRVARELLDNYCFPANVSVMDCGTMGMALLSEIRDYDTILVVDAVDKTGYPAGTVVTFSPEEIAPFEAWHGAHDTRFVDVLNAAELMGYSAEGHCLGEQIANMEPEEFAIGLTPQVEAAVPQMVAAVLDFLAGRGVEIGNGESPCISPKQDLAGT